MRSWCFDSIATEVDGITTYDREYGSAEFREVMRLFVGDGVYAKNSTNMQVIPNGDLSVSVLPGYCWVHGAMGAVDEPESLMLESSTSGRTDLIVARFDTSVAYRSIRLEVIRGTEGSAVSPALIRSDSVYDIQLAKVNIRAGASSILIADITDTRFDSAVCGIVTGIIDQIDATTLFSQYESVFNDFMTNLSDTLTGDVAGNLLVLINEHTADMNNPHNITAEQLGCALKAKVQTVILPANAGGSTVSVSCDVSTDALAFLLDFNNTLKDDNLLANTCTLIINSEMSTNYIYHDGAKIDPAYISVTISGGTMVITNKGVSMYKRSIDILEIR